MIAALAAFVLCVAYFFVIPTVLGVAFFFVFPAVKICRRVRRSAAERRRARVEQGGE